MFRDRSERGFSLLELLVVVATLGVLVAIAIPGLMTALDKSRQKRTMAGMRAITTALASYNTDHGQFPNLRGTTADLAPPLEAHYMRFTPRADGWGNDMIYGILDPAVDGASYIMRSYGKDGADDGLGGIGGETHDVNNDIVVFDGAFSQWPAGIQR